jgi:hypothetical protein
MAKIQLWTKALAAAALCLGMVVAAPAAASITQINSPITVKARVGWTITANYGGFVNEVGVSALQAQTVFTLKSVSSDKKTWVFDLTTLKNNTVAPVNSRVSIYGFDIDAFSTGGSSVARTSTTTTSTIFSQVDSGNVPQIGPLLDVCFRAGGGGSGCSSGGGGGVFPTTPAPLIIPTFTMSFASAVESLTFNNFFVRYQAIDGGGFNDASGVGLVQTVSFTDPLPEPGVWLQMIAGFGLVGAVRRRQQRPIAA